MAAEPGETEAVDTTGVSVAHGRAVHRTGKGLQTGKAGERLLRCGRSLNVAEQWALLKAWIIAVAGLEDNDLHVQKELVPVFAAEHQEEDEGQGTAEAFPMLQIGIGASVNHEALGEFAWERFSSRRA